jgi:hypothetical protein
VFLGLGVPEWLLIFGIAGALWLTFRVMANASVRYEKARQAREMKEREDQT